MTSPLAGSTLLPTVRRINQLPNIEGAGVSRLMRAMREEADAMRLASLLFYVLEYAAP